MGCLIGKKKKKNNDVQNNQQLNTFPTITKTSLNSEYPNFNKTQHQPDIFQKSLQQQDILQIQKPIQVEKKQEMFTPIRQSQQYEPKKQTDISKQQVSQVIQKPNQVEKKIEISTSIRLSYSSTLKEITKKDISKEVQSRYSTNLDSQQIQQTNQYENLRQISNPIRSTYQYQPKISQNNSLKLACQQIQQPIQEEKQTNIYNPIRQSYQNEKNTYQDIYKEEYKPYCQTLVNQQIQQPSQYQMKREISTPIKLSYQSKPKSILKKDIYQQEYQPNSYLDYQQIQQPYHDVMERQISTPNRLSDQYQPNIIQDASQSQYQPYSNILDSQQIQQPNNYKKSIETLNFKNYNNLQNLRQPQEQYQQENEQNLAYYTPTYKQQSKLQINIFKEDQSQSKVYSSQSINHPQQEQQKNYFSTPKKSTYPNRLSYQLNTIKDDINQDSDSKSNMNRYISNRPQSQNQRNEIGILQKNNFLLDTQQQKSMTSKDILKKYQSSYSSFSNQKIKQPSQQYKLTVNNIPNRISYIEKLLNSRIPSLSNQATQSRQQSQKKQINPLNYIPKTRNRFSQPLTTQQKKQPDMHLESRFDQIRQKISQQKSRLSSNLTFVSQTINQRQQQAQQIEVYNPQKFNQIQDFNQVQKTQEISNTLNINTIRNQIILLLQIPSQCLDSTHDQTDINNPQDKIQVGQIQGQSQFYIYPQGYNSIGLDISQYSDKKWKKYSSGKKSWIILYHKTIPAGVNDIIQNGFKIGHRQAHRDNICRFDGNKCGNGVYFSDNINSCLEFGQHLEIENKKYHLIFMCRVHPNFIKSPKDKPQFYIVTDTTKIRPVQLMFKEAIKS